MSFISLFPTFDLFILFLFVAAVLLHLLFIKKTKLFINFVSVYISFALVIILPLFISQVATWLALYSWVRAVAFLGVYILLGLIFHFSNLNEFSSRVSPTEFSISLIYRLGIVGLLFATVIYFLPAELKVNFGVIVNNLFNTFLALLCWAILPLLFAFAYRFKTRRGWL